MRNSALLIVPLALMLAGCVGRSGPPPDIRVPLPEAPARLQTKCERPAVTVGQDAVQALYQTRSALKTCEGKRAGWNKFYGDVRKKR